MTDAKSPENIDPIRPVESNESLETLQQFLQRCLDEDRPAPVPLHLMVMPCNRCQ
jgi:hypothetical protein